MSCHVMLCSTNQCILATAGMQAEAVTLRKVLDARIQLYRQKHGKVSPSHIITHAHRCHHG